MRMARWFLSLISEQARERDIYDPGPFLHSKLFERNGYKLNGEIIEKRFHNDL